MNRTEKALTIGGCLIDAYAGIIDSIIQLVRIPC